MAGVFVVFGAWVGKALGFIFPTSQRQQRALVQLSLPALRASASPGLGQDVSAFVAWWPRVRLLKGRGVTGVWPAAQPGPWHSSLCSASKNRPDLELGQKHDLKHTEGLGEFWAAPLPPDPGCCLSQKFGVRNVSRWISAAAGSVLTEQKHLQ